MSLFPFLIVKTEHTVQLLVVDGLSEAAEAVGVPKDAIVFVGDDKRYAHLGVVLEKVLVPAFHVQLLRLVLTQAVESLVGRTVKHHLPRKTVALLFAHFRTIHADVTTWHTVFPEPLAVFRLTEQRQPLTIGKAHRSRPLADHGLQTGRPQHDYRVGLVYHESWQLSDLRYNHQTVGLLRELLFRRRPDSHRSLVNNL